MAMESAMTGHLVFSTIHTNSAAETITRVFNLGAKPYMLAGTFNLVVAQRLARTLDHSTKVKVSVKDSPLYAFAKDSLQRYDRNLLSKELKLRGITKEQRDMFVTDAYAYTAGKKDETGKLVVTDDGSGLKGRTGLFEIMDYTDDLRNMILLNKTAFEIEQWALEHGMVNLERDGIFKVMKGIISLEELYRLVKHRSI